LSDYKHPPVVLKVIEGMKVGELCRVTSTRLDRKMRGNFPNEELKFDQTKIPEKDAKVVFWVQLLDKDQPEYFYKLTIQEKVDRILYLKNLAASFFKVQNFKKAGRIYQKANGYFSFGDTSNNF